MEHVCDTSNSTMYSKVKNGMTYDGLCWQDQLK